ncbi:MAG TPA: GGDEF domain-containing phosphodiesterase [Terracidiphilus sp.]|nr:GGDEF domain-containing phosphodiesterase [Terracidiphilus sp.]
MLFAQPDESAVPDQSTLHEHAIAAADRREAALSVLESMDNELRREIIAYANRHDVHTGLLNFHAFQVELDSLLRRMPSVPEGAVVWIDVLNVRREFALWGVEAAELLVRNVADVLRSGAGEKTLLGRFGARCFVMAMPIDHADPGVRQHLQSLVNSLLQLGSGEIDSSPEVSAGIAFYPSDATRAEDLLRYASLASARARYTRSSSILSFQPEMKKLLLRSHQLEVEIGKSLERNEFSMLYQSKIDLNTGEVLGAEALMRWQHPEWGAVPPSEFIPIAERSSLIQRVFDFSLRTALENVRHWVELGIAPGVISVNVSAANLRRDDFARRVRALMTEFPIDPVELELEVTETLLLDDEELFTARMRQLKSIGVRLAIDDFGTRYTGFNLLKRLPLDTMKIDRCFIRGIHQSADMRTLCGTILAMARHMKLRTIAEGIEEPEELEVMRQIGCDSGQGYLFQRPVSPEEFIVFLREWPRRSCGLGFGSADTLPESDLVCGQGRPPAQGCRVHSL